MCCYVNLFFWTGRNVALSRFYTSHKWREITLIFKPSPGICRNIWALPGDVDLITRCVVSLSLFPGSDLQLGVRRRRGRVQH